MSGPTYTYTADTPQSAQAMNNSQSEILSNFRAINELVDVNHVGFNSTNVGKHNYVTLLYQTDEPAVQSDDLTMYCQATGSPNAAEIFYTYPSSTSTPSQLTDQDIPVTGTGTSFGTASQGYCTFTSGVKIRWGVANAGYATSTELNTFTIGTPAYSSYLLCSATSPTQTGAYTPMGILVNGYISTTNFYAINYGATPASSSTVVTINYFMMGI